MVTEVAAEAREVVRDKVVDAVVVGAGFGGLYMIHRLRQAGFTVQGIEAGGDVGGTWYWNRYPGARCDIPSLLYSYTFSPDLQNEWHWSEKYATQPELLKYANHVADRFGLRNSFLFDTRVSSARFDEKAERWTVETERGDRLIARFVVMATGCLSVPRQPDIKGAENFKGRSIITGLWPHDGVDFTGERVAVIGTGSSAIQSSPLIAKQAKHLYLFQRTPNFSLPAKNRPLTDEEVAEFKAAFPAFKEALDQGLPGIPLPPPDWVPSAEELRALVENTWEGMGLVALAGIPNLTRDTKINEVCAEFVRGKIREIVKDPKTAEKLIPRDYPIGAKRACVDTDFYAMFNRDNVSLVDLRETPIVEVTAKGVKTSDKEYEVFTIVYAMGFDAMTGALTRIDIRGRDGESLKDAWEHGPISYLGLQVAGFPNLFTITGPGSPSVLSNMILSIEQHVDWIADALLHMREHGASVMEARPEAQDEWVAKVSAEADQTLYPQANSWYIGANVPGKPRVFMPYVGQDYKLVVDEKVRQGYEGFALSK